MPCVVSLATLPNSRGRGGPGTRRVLEACPPYAPLTGRTLGIPWRRRSSALHLERKVLKEISVGGLNPNETVQASLEAQLLSKLDHPAIVKFHSSFVEQDNFCIITEYCEGRDLDYKIQEYKEAGRTFPEGQIIEWFVQLLLGVDYMHERRILHRDLKSKNIFLKNNVLKIGDFGVSRLLMGSCDLATTLTGTPHYMSPEALKHQGYDTKSDICY